MFYTGQMVSGDLIKEARLRAGLTQTELADRLGKAQSEVARWERGAVLPSLESLRRVVRACGLEIRFELVPEDDSLSSLIDQNLRMTPAERFRQARQRAAFRNRRERVRGAA